MIYLEEVISPTHLMLLGNGMTGPNIGWPTSPETERLRAGASASPCGRRRPPPSASR
jgi:hypothetical protein